MKTDHLNLWERMLYAVIQGEVWDGNATEYGYAWCSVEADETRRLIWQELSLDHETDEHCKASELPARAIVIEDSQGGVSVVTFHQEENWREAILSLETDYAAWLEADEDEV